VVQLRGSQIPELPVASVSFCAEAAMPSYKDETGFLPPCPTERGTSGQAWTARNGKPRAQEMDESLLLTQQMKEHIEGLTARQTEAIRKMKDSKSTVQKLHDQVNSMQQQIEAVKTDKANSAKATEEMKTQMAKLENEHAVLHATHTWTKSSLDSALAAQEEYRKGYNSLRAAFKKAKDDIENANQELANSKHYKQELEKARATLDERKAHWNKELDAVNATMKRIAARHKDKSKAVLDRMLAGQASGLMGTSFAAWVAYLKDWKNSESAKAAVEAAQAKIQDFQDKYKGGAKQFLSRMTAASESGLVSSVWKVWLEACADTFKERKDAENMASALRNQKLEARKKVEASLGETMRGQKAVTFKNWAQTIREEREEREFKAQADAVMKEYSRKKRGQSLQVVDRMATKKENAVLAQLTLLWKVISVSQIAQRYREAEAQKRLQTIGGDIEVEKKKLVEIKEKLEDAQEELAAVKGKNKAMRNQLQQIMDLEDNMERVQEELFKDT